MVRCTCPRCSNRRTLTLTRRARRANAALPGLRAYERPNRRNGLGVYESSRGRCWARDGRYGTPRRGAVDPWADLFHAEVNRNR